MQLRAGRVIDDALAIVHLNAFCRLVLGRRDTHSSYSIKRFAHSPRDNSEWVSMVRWLQNLINDSSGFTAIEYALIAALMAVAAIAAIA